MDSFYYNSSTIIKYLRKVLNEINKDYVDSGLRAGFIMKRFCERNKFDAEYAQKLVLLCVLKDIGCFYHDQVVDVNNDALVAASSYAFLKHCSPFGVNAKPLLFYRAKYLEDIENAILNLIRFIANGTNLTQEVYEIIRKTAESHIHEFPIMLLYAYDLIERSNSSSSFLSVRICCSLRYSNL